MGTGEIGETVNSSKSSSTSGDNSAKQGTRLGDEAKSFLKNVAFLLIAFFALRGTIIEAFKIPSGSMIPTLKIGDHLLVNKLSYGLRLIGVRSTLLQWSQPKRGDVVVFTRDDEPATREDESSINFIKRVIGLPGDSVEVRGSTVLINGKELTEPYANWDGEESEVNFGPKTVPAGCVFLMGDNRNNSRDSRYWLNPFLDMKYIKGRALFIYWSWDGLERIGTVIR
jgi:signal peptidase I